MLYLACSSCRPRPSLQRPGCRVAVQPRASFRQADPCAESAAPAVLDGVLRLRDCANLRLCVLRGLDFGESSTRNLEDRRPQGVFVEELASLSLREFADH